MLTESGSEVAPVCPSEREEFINDSSDERPDAGFFQKLGMGWCLKYDACRMKGNRSTLD